MGSRPRPGDYAQTAGGVLVIDVGGPNPGTDFDQFNNTGKATLDGTLTVNLINGFVPNSGDNFAVLTVCRRSGESSKHFSEVRE